MRLHDAYFLYLEHRKKARISPKTLALDEQRAPSLLATLGGLEVASLTADDIRSYQEARRAKVGGRTINIELGLLRRVLKGCGQWARLSEEIEFEQEKSTGGRVISEEQKRRLFELSEEKPRWFVCSCAAFIAANTSLRPVELLGLQWQDVDLSGRTVAVRRTKGRTAGVRTIPLNESASAAFLRLYERCKTLGWTDPDDWVFPGNETAGELTRARPARGWRTAWRSLTEAAGLRGLRFYDLRHQVITELCEKGVPDRVVSEIAGHSSPEMLKTYTHIRMGKMREAVESLGQTNGKLPPGRAARSQGAALAQAFRALADLVELMDETGRAS